jgi:predicted TIM-barrel fold metal-dependent hydrolase
MNKIYDTHAHLISDDWAGYPPRPLRPEMPVPARTDYTVTAEALIQQMDQLDVATACVVQRGHLYGYDNSYIIEAGRRFPHRLLPVVILDTQDPGTPALFTDMVKNQGVRGIRMANVRPAHLDTAWMSSPTCMQIWKTCADLGAPVAIITFNNQVPWVLPLLRYIAKLYPQLPILIDHVGIAWGTSLPEVAWGRESGIEVVMQPGPDYGIDETVGIFDDTPNVYFKFTEINIERMQERSVDTAPVVRRLVDRFGPERLVWGSDVGQSLKWPFPDKVRHAVESAALLNAQERALFLHDNAARIYGGKR